MTMAAASSAGRRPFQQERLPARSGHQGAKTHLVVLGEGGRRGVFCSPTWIWGRRKRLPSPNITWGTELRRMLGSAAPQCFSSRSPWCLWVQEGTTQSFASSRGEERRPEEPAWRAALASGALAAEGGRPRRLQPSFHPPAWNQQLHLWDTGLRREMLCSLCQLLRRPEGRGISARKKSSLWIHISFCAGKDYFATCTETARPALPSLLRAPRRWERTLPGTATDLPEHTGSITLKKESRSCEQS